MSHLGQEVKITEEQMERRMGIGTDSYRYIDGQVGR
jgi:hypothetical protein